MFKKYMKKVLAFTLAGALAFSGAQIANVGGAEYASAAPASTTTVVTVYPGGTPATANVNVEAAKIGSAADGAVGVYAASDTTYSNNLLSATAPDATGTKFTTANSGATAWNASASAYAEALKAGSKVGVGDYVMRFSSATESKEFLVGVKVAKANATFATKEIWLNQNDTEGVKVTVNGVDDNQADATFKNVALSFDKDAAGTTITPTGSTTTFDDPAIDAAQTASDNKIVMDIKAIASQTTGDKKLYLFENGELVDTLTVHVLAAPKLEFTPNATPSIILGGSADLKASNVSSTALDLYYYNNHATAWVKLTGGAEDPFTVTKSALGADRSMTYTVTAVAGKATQATYRFALTNGTHAVYGTTGTPVESGVLTLGGYPAGSSATLSLGLGETQTVKFKLSAAYPTQTSYTVTPTNKNVASSVTASDDGTNVTVTVVGDDSVGGKETFTVKGANGKQYGVVNVTVSNKSSFGGVNTTPSVAVDGTVNMFPQNAANTTTDWTKIKLFDKEGNSVANPSIGGDVNHYSVSFDQADFAEVSDITKGQIKGLVAGTVTGTLKAWSASAEVSANLIASTAITVTIAPKSTLTVTDEKGNVLGGTNFVYLDALKNTSKTVIINKPDGTTATVKSSNEAVATMDTNGVITAKKAGEATMTVSTAAVGTTIPALSTSFVVKVAAKPDNKLTVKDDTGVVPTNLNELGRKDADMGVFNKTEGKDVAVKLNLKTRSEGSLVVTAEDTTAQVKFTTVGTASNYFTVDPFTGKITTKAGVVGEGYVDISTPETAGYAATTYRVFVSVTEKPEDVITVDAENIKLVVGKTQSINASSAAGAKLSYKTANGKTVAGATDNGIVTVDATGRITAVKAGTVDVIVTAAATDTTIITEKKIKVTVNEFSDNTIVVKNAKTGETIGDALTITEAIEIEVSASGNPTTITVDSQNKDIISVSAPVDNKRTVTPNKEGTAVIKIEALGATKFADTTRYIVMTYGKGETSIVADPSVSVKVGETVTINAKASDDAALTFESADSTIASVDASTGVVTGVAAGSTVVSIKSATGAQTYTIVTVTGAAVTKKANTIKVTKKAITVKAKTLKKKALTRKAFTVKSAKGTVSYTKKSGSAKLTVTKAGKIKIKKGTKKGTYKIKVAIKAAGNTSYKAKTLNRTVTVKVK